MNSSPSTDTIASASNLGGESAIVTGGSRGIGAAIVKALVGARATVVIAGGSEKHGRDLAADLGCHYLPHDVSSEQSWETLLSRVRDDLGDVTVLVNNAGLLDPGHDISETSVKNFERHYRVNQLGVFLGMRTVAAEMKQRGSGSIINLSSIGGHRGYANQIGYSTTKWAVRGMTKYAAVELGPYGCAYTPCARIHQHHDDRRHAIRANRCRHPCHSVAAAWHGRRDRAGSSVSRILGMLVHEWHRTGR